MLNCSVVIPARNASQTIGRTLESLLDQTTPRNNYEIIVVDDGSTDNTAKVVSRYPVKYCRQEHHGPAAARNAGAASASGEILVFVDADCTADRIFLDEITRPLGTDPEIIGVQGSYRSCQKELMARFVQHEIEDRYWRMRRADAIDFIGSYAAAYRATAFFEVGGFDTTYPMASGEDTELSYRLAEAGKKMVFCPEAIVWHQHPSRLWRYLRVKFSRGFWRVRLYASHPRKIVKDSYTPHTLKFQVLLVSIACLGLLVASVLAVMGIGSWMFSLSVALLSLSGVMVLSLPLTASFRAAGNREYLAVPILVFLRGIALAAGLLSGVLAGASKRERKVSPR